MKTIVTLIKHSLLKPFIFIVFLSLLLPGASTPIKPKLYKQMEFRFIGPQGNRYIAVCGIPGDPLVYYAGSASGGIFKSTDGGTHWRPVFDDHPVASIGSIAAAPSDSNIVWAGTGEISIRSNVSQGMGIFKSSDAGASWTNMGLKETGRIGRIIIHPTNPDIVYAAAMGHCYGPQQERGVFRTMDGGKTWKRVLFVDENTGCSDIVMAPDNPRVLLAGMWPMHIWPWLERKSGGPGGGIHLSSDGGSTWKHLKENGLPKPPLGKIALAVSPDNPNRIYALIESKEGVLWRSDSKGQSWRPVNRSHELTQRPAYYTRCAVSPNDFNEVYFLATQFSVSLDGGETHKTISYKQSPGGDHHDMWIDPQNPDRMVVGSDLCVSISLNRGKTWDKVILPTAQMYHVAVDNRVPYLVYGNRQDGPSTHGPSNSLTGATIPSGMWKPVGGCECGFAVPDPVDTHIVWSGCFEGMLDRFDLNTGQGRAVGVWPDSCLGWAAEKLKYRFQWTFPIVISPHDHNTVYVGSQYVHRTINGGHKWTIISPDLTTNDKSKQHPFGGLTRDDESTYSCCIFAIAESPLAKGLIWVGTNDGQVQVTRDGGKQWTNVTKNIPKLPKMGVVSNIEPSRYEAGACYISVDTHYTNNRDPYLYKTSNYGKKWKRIDAGIPRSSLSYTHCIREDPRRKGMLYAGTENALYMSLDDGKKWLPLQHKLPHAPVHWMVVQEHFNDLVVGTYGRGFYILDDITPLRKLDPEVLDSDVYLFKPRQAYRFLMKGEPMVDPDDPSVGFNPPYGASIHYYLKTKPKGPITLTILDEKGQTVSVMKSAKENQPGLTPLEESEIEKPDIKLPKKEGINRVWWNLFYDKTKTIKLRTPPPGAPYVRTQSNGWRPLKSYAEPVQVWAAPGTYTVKLDVDGQTFTQTLLVKQDPNSPASEPEVKKQVELALEVRDQVNRLSSMVNRIEWTRKQLLDLVDILTGEKDARPVIDEAKRLDQKLLDIEKYLFQVKMTGSRDDILRLPARLHYKLFALAYGIGQSDYPPTTQQLEVYRMYREQLDSFEARLEHILTKDLDAFHRVLKARDLSPVIRKMD
jgi:photosystem II stability/assembly factor-like uncharacterized protein